MVEIFLAGSYNEPIARFNSVYAYAKLEAISRKGTIMAQSIKAISSSAYVHLANIKNDRKTYSHYFKNYIQIRRTDSHPAHKTNQ
jgi:hypothetical protein